MECHSSRQIRPVPTLKRRYLISTSTKSALLRAHNGVSYSAASRLTHEESTPRSSICSTVPPIGPISRRQIVGGMFDPACNVKDRHDICSDTGENPLWNSTEPYYDSFYCNVCYHARPSSIYTDVRHTVGHLSHVIPFHGIARSGDFRKDSPRHDQHSTA